MIIGVHHLLRFDIDGLAGSRLIVNDTAYLAFVAGRNGYHEPALTEGRRSVRINQTVRFGLPQDSSQRASDAALQVAYLATDTR